MKELQDSVSVDWMQDSDPETVEDSSPPDGHLLQSILQRCHETIDKTHAHFLDSRSMGLQDQISSFLRQKGRIEEIGRLLRSIGENSRLLAALAPTVPIAYDLYFFVNNLAEDPTVEVEHRTTKRRLRYIEFYTTYLCDVLAIVTQTSVCETWIREAEPNEWYFSTLDHNRIRERFPEADLVLIKRLVRSVGARRTRLFAVASQKARNEYKEKGNTWEWQLDAAGSEDTLASGVYAKRFGDLRARKSFDCETCMCKTELQETGSFDEHMDRDIKPFICTFIECSSRGITFDSLERWFEHEQLCRRSLWECPRCIDHPVLFTSESEFQIHVLKKHRDEWHQVNDLLLNSKKQHDKSLRRSTRCPLCDYRAKSLLEIKMHLGEHLREVALFSLPDELPEDVATT